MYLRQTKRKNKNGTVAHYLQLTHNVCDPDTGVVTAQVLHSFGRAEQVERDALERLIASIERYLGTEVPTAGAAVSDVGLAPDGVEVLDARNLGGVWVLDQLWRRLGIDRAVRQALGGRKLEVALVERVIFALVAGRALAPSSKLEATRWIREEVYGSVRRSTSRLWPRSTPTETCYRTMDVLLEVLPVLQETVFFAVADLLQLDVDVIFFDTTTTYFELDFEDGELADDDDEVQRFRIRAGDSKDSRPDLPQVKIGMAVTTGGMPVRLWVWPGNTNDQTVLDEVKANLAGWRLNRTVWVVDAGFTSADNRKILTRGGSGFIIAEKLHGNEHAIIEARGRQGRYRTVDEHLQVKQVLVGEGPATQRFIMMRNLAEAEREAHTRNRLVALLEARIAGSDELDADARAELRGRIREKPGLWRYLRITKTGLLRIDRSKIASHAKLDGKTLLRTSDLTMDAAEVARGYKALQDVERGFRDLKQLELRPVYHRLEHRIVAHIQLCWLSLLLIRTAEIACDDTWRNISTQLERIRLVTLSLPGGTVSQRTRLTEQQHAIDLDADTVTCPAGNTVPIVRSTDGSGKARFAARCQSCPLRERCTDAVGGRAVSVHRHEALLARQRDRATDPDWSADYRATRPKVERKLAHLVRRGRRARRRGLERVDADWTLLAGAVNLARMTTLGVHYGGQRWETTPA